MVDDILRISKAVRYVAIYREGRLESRSRANTARASGTESDRYEELLVNPALIKLASQRGNIDCGGLDFLLVRYGNFYQFVLPQDWGHVSVCVEPDADPLEIGARVTSLVRGKSPGRD